MYLLDTNVLSELRRRSRSNPKVATWADAIDPSELFLSAITILEIEVGVLLLQRRDKAQGAVLRTWIDDHVMRAFDGRVLPVDAEVARQCAALHVPNPRAERDALIAATALVHGLKLATRNVEDFKNMEIEIINPWD